VALELVAQGFGVSEQIDIAVLSIGIAEHKDGTGWSFVFQSGLPHIADADFARSYSLVTERGVSVDDGVTTLLLTTESLDISLLPEAAEELALPTTIMIRLDITPADFGQLAHGLARIFSNVDAESRPAMLVIPGYGQAITKPKGRPSGRRIEFEVISERNGLATVQQVGENSRPTKELASFLAQQLGVPEDHLVGRRYTCFAVPDRWGTTHSDFRLT
jgi:hypothetical protein